MIETVLWVLTVIGIYGLIVIGSLLYREAKALREEIGSQDPFKIMDRIRTLEEENEGVSEILQEYERVIKERSSEALKESS